MNADRDELVRLLLEFLKPPKYSGGSWTYSPHEAADAVLASGWLRNHDAGVWDAGAAHVDGRQHYDADDNPYRRPTDD